MRRAAGSIPGARLYLTGQAATEHDLDPVFSEDLKKGELYLAIPIALVIPTVSVIAALTFLPVLLSLVGSRLERIRLLPKELMERRADHEHGAEAVAGRDRDDRVPAAARGPPPVG